MSLRLDIDDSEVARLYASGFGLRQIGAQLGIHPSTAGRRLRDLGVVARQPGLPAVDEENQARIIGMYTQQGMTITEIAEELGVHFSTVWKYLKLGGVLRSQSEGRILSFQQGKTVAPNPVLPVGSRFLDYRGYVWVKVPGHSHANVQGWVQEHIAIWEEANGPVPTGWVIHHVNGVKDDNRLENLEAMPREDHVRVHRHNGAVPEHLAACQRVASTMEV